MTISFKMLWLLWIGGVVYDLSAAGLGLFQNRTLADRMFGQSEIAWFILSAYACVAIYRYFVGQRILA